MALAYFDACKPETNNDLDHDSTAPVTIAGSPSALWIDNRILMGRIAYEHIHGDSNRHKQKLAL